MRRNSDWNPFRDLVRKETGDLGLEKALTGELWNDRAVEAVDGSCLSAFERAKGRRRAKAMIIWMLVDIVVIKAECRKVDDGFLRLYSLPAADDVGKMDSSRKISRAAS